MSKTPLWEPWVHGTVVISTQGGLGGGGQEVCGTLEELQAALDLRGGLQGKV